MQRVTVSRASKMPQSDTNPAQLRVALVCPRMTPADPRRNLLTLRGWAERAAEQLADIVVFPECFISGYAEAFMIDEGYVTAEQVVSTAEPVPGPATDTLVALSRELGICICAGLLEKTADGNFNTQVLVDPDQGLLGRYRKVQVGPKETWLCSGGSEWPVFNVRGMPTGMLLCRDKSHPEAARILALNGAQLLLIPHSSTVVPEMEFRTWSLKLCVARAMENACYVLVNNNIYDCPMTRGRSQAGYSYAIDPYGEVLHCDEGPPDTEKMTVVTVDGAVVAARRALEGPGFNLDTRRPETYARLTEGIRNEP